VARTVLVLGAVTVSGCVIPVSLQQEQQAANYPPVLISSSVPFGSEIVRAKGDMTAGAIVAPVIVVEDLDAAEQPIETVTARLFKLNGIGTLTFLNVETTLTPETLNPTRFDGTLTPTPWCALFANNMTATFDIILIVADRPFFPIGSGRESEVQGAMGDGGQMSYTASQSWRFLCQ
jgi:hypothetical protein